MEGSKADTCDDKGMLENTLDTIQPKLAIPMHYGAIVGDDRDALAFEEALKGKIDVLILPKA